MKTAVSLFSSGGIGDLAVKATGWDILVANEILSDRVQVFKNNYPETKMIEGDIRIKEKEIIDSTKSLLGNKELDLLFATPPCQGMSKNGRGKLLQGIREGLKPKFDERNTLIINAVNCIKALQPRIVVFENVPEMENTLIDLPNKEIINILDWISKELSPDYFGKWKVIEFADYGVPQRRQRLITIFSKDDKIKSHIKKGSIFPCPTHAKEESLLYKKWVSVNEAIKDVPKLDARCKESAISEIPFHSVPVLDTDKYYWVSNTPPGRGAFDNQCVNPNCLYSDNPTHKAEHNEDGINQSSKETPIKCIKCGELLPRPWVKKNENYRLMSGFTSAYKRMRGDLPASALTSNLSYACSDQKIHPTQNRVLSLYEAFILHTIVNYKFDWNRADRKKVSDKTIREIIGESIPPMGLQKILQHIYSLSDKKTDYNEKADSVSITL